MKLHPSSPCTSLNQTPLPHQPGSSRALQNKDIPTQRQTLIADIRQHSAVRVPDELREACGKWIDFTLACVAAAWGHVEVSQAHLSAPPRTQPLDTHTNAHHFVYRCCIK